MSDRPHDSRVVGVTTDGPDPATLLVPQGPGGAWLVDPGPPGSDAARDLLWDQAPNTRAAGVFATRTDEDHVGVLPELADRFHDNARFVVSPGGTDEGRAAVERAANAGRGEGEVFSPEPGEAVAIDGDVAVVPLTDPRRREHPDAMSLDVRVRDPHAPAAQPENLLLPGDVDEGDEATVRRAAAGIYAHSESLHELESPATRVRPWHSRLYLHHEWRDAVEEPTHVQASLVDHRHRDDGVGELVSDATSGLLFGADQSPPAETGDAGVAHADPDGNGWVELHVTSRGTELVPARGSVETQLVDRQADRVDDDREAADGNAGRGQ